MSKKRKHEEEEEEEVAPFWMISFSDLMTLLLAFFIILFSISTIEQKKMTELMEAMGSRYLTHGSRHAGNKAPTADPNLPKTKVLREHPDQHQSDTLSPPPDKSKTIQDTVITFQSGHDELDDAGKQSLTQLAQQLQGRPYPIQVAGHAAQKEIAESSIYRKTDDLAYTRAYNVRDFLLSQGLKPERFSLVIMGPYQPLQQSESAPVTNTYVEVREVTDKD
ncbi:MAG: OmpA family protein [Planctomycetaceae bacterium]|jgi:chemotaxis protein MotB|nr:OmpA family protein [Planctomycetaceae bacterium]